MRSIGFHLVNNSRRLDRGAGQIAPLDPAPRRGVHGGGNKGRPCAMSLSSIDQVQEKLTQHDYVCGRALATVVFLSLTLGRPLFLEGEAGTGKTEIAKAIAAALGRRLIRLQCYEGLDASSAVYEWNFAAQMVAIRATEASGVGGDADRLRHDLFSDDYLIERPLLQ